MSRAWWQTSASASRRKQQKYDTSAYSNARQQHSFQYIRHATVDWPHSTMPPAKERAKTNAGSDVKKGKSDPKGKQRAVEQDDIDLDVDTFLRNQIKALAAPLKPLDRSEYYTEGVDGKTHDPPLQKTLDKAVKALKCVFIHRFGILPMLKSLQLAASGSSTTKTHGRVSSSYRRADRMPQGGAGCSV